MISAQAQLTLPEIPRQLPEVHVEPPMVFVQPVWEYQELVRALPDPGPMSETELNDLGARGWELVTVYAEPGSLHFYFKRLVR